MNKIEAYFDSEIGAWMLRGTRRKSNKIFPDQASAERAARRAEKARQTNYRNIKITYDDIYLTSIFLPRSKCLLISWLQSPSAVILEPQKIKSDIVSTVSPLSFLNVEL